MNKQELHALNVRAIAAGLDYGDMPKLWVKNLDAAADYIERTTDADAIREYCEQFVDGDPGADAVATGVLEILNGVSVDENTGGE